MALRLFIAVELPEPWREAARAARAEIEREVGAPVAASMRWVDPTLMHLTVRFVGEIDEPGLAPLREALDRVVPPVDVELTIDGAGTFGPPARTDAAWIGVCGDVDGLRALVERVEAAVVAAGLPPEERTFRAHVTLARLGRRASRDERRAVARVVAGLTRPPRASFHARSVALVRSHLGRGGPRYEVRSRHG